MIKPIELIFSGHTLAMSSTSRCTMGLPAMGNNGFAVVRVCGRRRLPVRDRRRHNRFRDRRPQDDRMHMPSRGDSARRSIRNAPFPKHETELAESRRILSRATRKNPQRKNQTRQSTLLQRHRNAVSALGSRSPSTPVPRRRRQTFPPRG